MSLCGLPRDGRIANGHALASATWVADRDWALQRQGGAQRLGELVLVCRRKHRHVGYRSQVRQIEHAVVRGSVLAHQAGTVQAEHDGQVLQRGIHDELIVRTLQERRIDGDHRPPAAHRHARGKTHGVFFGDAHVEEP